MTTKNKSSAKKTYRVWADELHRVFQDIEATSPEQALDLAEGSPDAWERCDEYYDGINMSCEVEDRETEQFHKVGAATHCRTCRSEIVEKINDSNFRDGECGRCEYERYKTQPALQEVCERANALLANWENGNIGPYAQALAKATAKSNESDK